MNTIFSQYFSESSEVLRHLALDSKVLFKTEKVASAITSCYRQGGKVLIFGNGGSAADAQHFAGELVSRFYFDRPGLPAFALTTDTPVLTAIGNDYGFEHVFSRQVEATAKAGDVVIGISTSGNSPNVVRGLEAARAIGAVTVGLTGAGDGAIQNACDFCICAPSFSTPHIQECHLVVEHAICAAVEEALFTKP